MEWDFFISHASEDKQDVAIPLAQQLQRAGYRVWLDAFELTIGESLRSRVDLGLSQSRFGIVIVSPAYFAKKWASAELGALFALDEPGNPRILPVWHGIDAGSVLRKSPLLADRVAITTDSAGGAFHLARMIIGQLRDRLADPGTVVNRFASRLELADISAVRAFLTHYPRQLVHAAGLTYGTNLSVYFRSDSDYPRSSWSPDIILQLYFPAHQPSLPGHSEFFVVTLGPLLLPDGPDRLHGARQAVAATGALVQHLAENHQSNRSRVAGAVALSRRANVTTGDIEALASPPQVRVRTYDWLVDAFLQCGPQSHHENVQVEFGSDPFND